MFAKAGTTCIYVCNYGELQVQNTLSLLLLFLVVLGSSVICMNQCRVVV